MAEPRDGAGAPPPFSPRPRTTPPPLAAASTTVPAATAGLAPTTPAGPRAATLRLVVAEDDPNTRLLFARALQQALRPSAGRLPASGARLELLTQVDSAEQALELCRTDPPDLLLLDQFLPGLHGLEIVRAIQRLAPQVRIILWSGQLTPELLTQALRLQLAGCVQKTHDHRELVHGLDQIAAGLSFYCARARALLRELRELLRPAEQASSSAPVRNGKPKPSRVPGLSPRAKAAGSATNATSPPPPPAPNHDQPRRKRSAATASVLTERERAIVRLLAAGHSSKQIAGTLRVSVHTVNAHRRALMSKLGARNAAGLVAAAQAMGLL